MKRRLLSWPVALAVVWATLAGPGCAYRDWSGLVATGGAADPFVAVNNRPAVIARCLLPDGDAGVPDCVPVGLPTRTWLQFDVEAVTHLGGDRFAAAFEKTSQRCLGGGCRLDQRIRFFRLDVSAGLAARARPDACPDVTIPLLDGDDPHCAWANCGLEALAADVPGRSLYAGKENYRPRLYRLPLDAAGCAGPVADSWDLGDRVHSIADAAVVRVDGAARLFLLVRVVVAAGARALPVVLGVPIGPDGAPRLDEPFHDSREDAELNAWLAGHTDSEGLAAWVEPAGIEVAVMAESGAVRRYRLPAAAR